jgi:hypothetical protein
MILVHRRPFSVSRFHERMHPDTAGSALASGPVLRVRLRFERWLGGEGRDADAFIDPGADETILSLRWIEELGGRGRRARPRVSVPDPHLPGHYLLEEEVKVEIAGCELALGTTRPVRVLAQPPMPGFEDVLLGRDFLAAHRLLLLLDGQDREFSILFPTDAENQRQREGILAALVEAPRP